MVRDKIEAGNVKGIPWHKTKRNDVVRTTSVIRAERKAKGLCIYCGTDKADGGHVTCHDCRSVKRIKAKEAV